MSNNEAGRQFYLSTENSEALSDFVAYCRAHPSERFWQALLNWSGHNFIMVSDTRSGTNLRDTFYWNHKDGR